MQTPAEITPPATQKNDDVTVHAAPSPSAAHAVTSDWPCFLGPTHYAFSNETHLIADLTKTPPPIVWEMKKGSGYAAPAVVDGRLILLHRVGAEEVIECLDALSGDRYLRFGYPTTYEDRYGYCDGPCESGDCQWDGLRDRTRTIASCRTRSSGLWLIFWPTPNAGFGVHRVIRMTADLRRQGVWPMTDPLPSGWYGTRLLHDGGILPFMPPTSGLSLHRDVAERLFPLPLQAPLVTVPIN